VGLVVPAKVGDSISSGDRLATIHAADESAAKAVLPAVEAAFTLRDEPVAPLPIVYARVDEA
jgi:thymidine phosphorylase